MQEMERENYRMLEEITSNFNSERKVKNILLVGLPAAGKSSLINSFAYLILGRYLPIASVGHGNQLTHTLAADRYPQFGITEGHLRGSPKEGTARTIHPYLPHLTDFIGLADENTQEISEIFITADTRSP
ncbi:hypothetical protein CHS0354_004304 [Potamilus streckersoni]|uniref:Uncharacterized protein n=1 Tax=Potamilus streckersoni TaxID=2493646 RepID=A0AAE0S4Q2_9BIVA|nr:hypothetical protein CHS0354_004304 [Potamilus streckersoni]